MALMNGNDKPNGVALWGCGPETPPIGFDFTDSPIRADLPRLVREAADILDSSVWIGVRRVLVDALHLCSICRHRPLRSVVFRVSTYCDFCFAGGLPRLSACFTASFQSPSILSVSGFGPDDLPLQRRWRAVHLIVWEAANGPLPEGHAVAFVNGDKSDIRFENLVLVSRADLMRRNTLHRLPKELAHAYQLIGAVNRKINRRTREEQNRRPA